MKNIFRDLKMNGIVMSHPKIGYTISANWNNFLEIEHHQPNKYLSTLCNETIKQNYINLINQCLKEHNIDFLVNYDDFQCVKKTYIDSTNETVKLLKLFIPKHLFSKVNLKDFDNSIMYFYGINGWVIARKIILRIASKTNAFEFIKLIFDFDNNLLGIYQIKHFHPEGTLDLVVDKKIFM